MTPDSHQTTSDLPLSLRPVSPTRTAPAVTHEWSRRSPCPPGRASCPSGAPRAAGFPFPPLPAERPPDPAPLERPGRSQALGSPEGKPGEDGAVPCARVGGVAESPETARQVAATRSPSSSAPGLVVQARAPAPHRGGLATAS